ncbi:uncharacterized protein FRV6_04917 [Fusarium oxysporum]|uniref:Hypervirulence associated protein TUDOR domain-containing protein n=1 Tax=Fusarium oxysporum TaxID=5507 RepID=A0A2H3T7M5_FUSOX|nr:uncharacterized protein FRV6_04917 [Fusarium oxysporum]
MASNIEDKNAEALNKGDHVWTRIRGGRHEGDVERIVTTAKDAEKEEVKNPPKVLFKDQHGHRVAHNPGTLEHK